MAKKQKRIPRDPEPSSKESIGQRLRMTREALGYSQTHMARRIGLKGPSAWNMYESGARRIGVDFALRMCALFGCSTDWIYRGRIEGVIRDLADRIEAIQRSEN